MSSRAFQCSCQKCGREFIYNGSMEEFNDFMNAGDFSCPGGHRESRPPRYFVRTVSMSEPRPVQNWVPAKGRVYMDILDREAMEIKRMRLDHIGSGVYLDRRTGKKYDFEEDMKGRRHYFEVTA